MNGLKKIMEVNDRSASWLSRKIGVSPTSVINWMEGIHHPKTKYRKKIARIFKVTEMFIFGEE